MEYSIKKLAELANVTTRTLRYYDQIGLFKPARISESGYRCYDSTQIDRLQQILFYRELGLPLDQIASLLNDPRFDYQTALQSHLTILKRQRDHLDVLILTIEKTILHHAGEIDMSDQEKFEGFKQKLIQENENAYGDELRTKYGSEAIDNTNSKTQSLSQEEYNEWTSLKAEILSLLEQAVLTKTAPASKTGKHLTELHRRWLSYSWAHYSPAAHKGLAQMYTEDERFTAYYDRSIPGCAAYLREAILIHA